LALERLDELATIDDPAERLAAFIAHQVRIVAEERSLFSVFFENRPRLDDDYEVQIKTKERRYFRHFVAAVEHASGAGVIPKIDARFGAQAILGMSSWVYKWFDSDHDDATQVAGDFVELILRTRVQVDTVSFAKVLYPEARQS
jgi:hypothetical protein